MRAQHPVIESPTDLLNYDSRLDREFYVTIKRGDRTGWLLGPYATHDLALASVDRGRELAVKADTWASFDAFGTASVPTGTARKTVFGS
jgi:hypothetical protein